MSKTIWGMAAAGLVAASLVTTPIYATAQEGSSLSTLIEERERRAEEGKAKKSGGLLAKIGAVLATVGVAKVCNSVVGNSSQVGQVGCIVAGGLAGYGVLELDKKIHKRLQEKERAQLLAAAGDSLSDGQPRSLSFPDSGASASVTPVGELTFEDSKSFMFYDSLTLASRERVEVIAQPYLTTTNSNLRGSPDTSEKPVKTLAANTPLHVVGKIPDQDWYMVSQRVSEGENDALMVVGYMSSDVLVPADDDFIIPAMPAPATVQEAEFDVALRCNKLTFQVRDAKGKLVDDTSKSCIGPEGQLVSA
ncbi:MAG: SH3 domain-containing protein [Erythrobacter sp.]